MFYVYDLFALDGCWSSVFIKMIIVTFLNVYSSDNTNFVASGKIGITLIVLPYQLNGVATLTNRPKSVNDRCVIAKFLVAFLCFRLALFWFSVGKEAFVIEPSQIPSFSPLHIVPNVFDHIQCIHIGNVYKTCTLHNKRKSASKTHWENLSTRTIVYSLSTKEENSLLCHIVNLIYAKKVNIVITYQNRYKKEGDAIMEQIYL